MFKKLLALLVSAGIITAGVMLFRVRHTLFRPDFDRVGGTELLFELAQPNEDALERVCEVLLKRFDEDGSVGLRVEIQGGKIGLLVPNSKKHDELVLAIRRLAPRRGHFEFRILANDHEDKLGAEQARNWFLDPKNPLPVATKHAGGGPDFSVGIGASKQRYRWFRMTDPTARASLGRSPSPPTGVGLREVIPGGYNSPVHIANAPGGASSQFFVIAREPDNVEWPTGDHLKRVRFAYRDRGFSSGVEVTFEPEGLKRLRDLAPLTSGTSGPIGAGPPGAVLAGILDGEVIITHWIYAAQPRKLVYNLYGSTVEVEDLVMLMRGGELPVAFAPKHQERTVPPKR